MAELSLEQKEYNTLELALNSYSKATAPDSSDHLLTASEAKSLLGKLKGAVKTTEDAAAKAKAQEEEYRRQAEFGMHRDHGDQTARRAAAGETIGNPGVPQGPATITERAKSQGLQPETGKSAKA